MATQSPIILGQVAGLLDPLINNHFSMYIANPPGGGNGQDLRIRQMTGVLPSISNAVTEVPLHRHVIRTANRRRYPGSFTANFTDTSDVSVINSLFAWQAATTDPATGLPFPESNYKTVAQCTVYDASNQPAISRNFFGIWVSNIADHGLDGNSDALLGITVTFTYDFWLPDGITV